MVDGVPGVRFAVWAPNARRVSVVGDFNTWDGRRHPMRLRHEAGVWEIFVPRLARRRALQIRAARSRTARLLPHEGRSGRLAGRAAARHRVDRRRSGAVPLVGRGVVRGTGAAPGSRRADLDLRGACRFVAAPPRRTPARLVRACRETGRLRVPHGLHPCRVHAGDGASVCRVVGLSAARPIRAERAARHARGIRAARRPLPQCRHRRAARLGAGAFPDRCARAGAF